MIQLRMEDLRFRGFFPFFIIWLYPDRGHVGFLELAPAKLAELTSCPALEITSLIKKYHNSQDFIWFKSISILSG